MNPREKLQKLVDKVGITELARRKGVSRNALRNILNGTNPRLDTMIRLGLIRVSGNKKPRPETEASHGLL
jgi:hypothetical protein